MGPRGFIDWLDSLVSTIHRFAYPRLFCGMTPSVPAGRQITELQNGRIDLNGLMQRDDLSIFFARLAAEKLSTAIIGIVTCKIGSAPSRTWRVVNTAQSRG
jgi:hypothetical protein